ncbi:Gfo/Idh/MocA family oxidoreductase [Ruficoccus amylovorans]|uniref:Gfo/Idh/MocA family oxidoreductase n=1 Tax=Ruficoccus amylovorans TaxID=1804625 RepID=A0A842HJ46_9BACT|nr:Gfo/Idh/MocA family oxidoreductase [Ruficoccus amylovorans]MBC2595606.1 Gfo/Idh/MocA family oxidoreductase [Ruficoccus amylovorans]
MKNSDKIRFGFVGTGMITNSAADQINAHPHGEVVAAFDPSEVRVKNFCDKHKVTTPCTSLEALLADDKVDALYVATPNKFHAPSAMQALKAGKHVILEKPFAMSLAEAQAAVELARETGLTLSVGMNQRFTPDALKIKAAVEAGELGEIYHAKAYWRRRTGIPKLGTWFVSHEMAGGGALYDIGVHMLDLCLHCMDNFEPVAVSGATYSKFGPRGLGEGKWGMSDKSDIAFDVDDFASAFIRLANGATVNLEAVWACHTLAADSHNVELFGTEAGASVFPAKLFRFSKHDCAAYEILENLKDPEAPGMANRFTNFINHLHDGSALCCTLEQALAVQKVLDGIAESSRTGREVVLA